MSHSSSIPYASMTASNQNENDFRRKEQEVLSHLSFLKENRNNEMKKSANKTENDDSETESSSSLTNKDMIVKLIDTNKSYLNESAASNYYNMNSKSSHKSSDSLKQTNVPLMKPISQPASNSKNGLDLSLPNRSRLATNDSSSAGCHGDYKYPQIFSDISLSPLSYSSSNISALDSNSSENKDENKMKNDLKCKVIAKKYSSKIKHIEPPEKILIGDLKSKGTAKGNTNFLV